MRYEKHYSYSYSSGEELISDIHQVCKYDEPEAHMFGFKLYWPFTYDNLNLLKTKCNLLDFDNIILQCMEFIDIPNDAWTKIRMSNYISSCLIIITLKEIIINSEKFTSELDINIDKSTLLLLYAYVNQSLTYNEKEETRKIIDNIAPSKSQYYRLIKKGKIFLGYAMAKILCNTHIIDSNVLEDLRGLLYKYFPKKIPNLNTNEQAVLIMAARGMSSTKEISKTLGWTSGTVEARWRSIRKKLNVRSRLQAVTIAYEHDLIPLI